MAKCRSCNATIRWVKTQADRRMPIDPTPAADGNVVFDGNGRVRILGLDELVGGARFRSHFATCPNAASHRKGSDA